ncbi:hypothetical protein PSHT_15105 [Puccinia striiformis]|uniref:Uncharacterized protein n=1 Tax=Puccinia striiformis TaxID=27350 RepID=A0A2S4UGY8_9BASI|nr:hypothetical protein PSHT_15105 [Puccinia striiformis]
MDEESKTGHERCGATQFSEANPTSPSATPDAISISSTICIRLQEALGLDGVAFRRSQDMAAAMQMNPLLVCCMMFQSINQQLQQITLSIRDCSEVITQPSPVQSPSATVYNFSFHPDF